MRDGQSNAGLFGYMPISRFSSGGATPASPREFPNPKRSPAIPCDNSILSQRAAAPPSLAKPTPRLSQAPAISSIGTVQFSAPIFIVEECEEVLCIDVVRLGSLNGPASIKYKTVDGSAVAGEKYVADERVIHFAHGQHCKELQVRIRNSREWAPTLEFKVELSEPEGCELSTYLHTCRVKIIDNDLFPSSKYKDLENVSKVGLSVEYMKLNLSAPGVRWRTLLTLAMDQLRNLYVAFRLGVKIYMVDVLFNLKDPLTESWIFCRDRETTALIIGVLYFAPLFVLHAWDYWKIKIDLTGFSGTFLQKSLMRKYMNYSEESRAQVLAPDMLMAITQDCQDLAHGYAALLDAGRLLVKLAILTTFICRHSPDTLRYFIILPLLMLAFASSRHGLLAKADAEADEEVLGIMTFTEEVCLKYSLIAEYWQRPRMNDVFKSKAESVRRTRREQLLIRNNNEYFPEWLGTVSSGIFIITNSAAVLSGHLAVGRFLATISAFHTIASDFSSLYKVFLKLTRTMDPLIGLTEFFNMQTDLLCWKKVSRERTRMMKDSIPETCGRGVSASSPCIRFDELPIRFSNVVFHYVSHLKFKVEDDELQRMALTPILNDVSISIEQGKLVALMGEPDSGKATLLRLLGHTLFPVNGHIFVPPHLRIVHVSRDPILVKGSPWRNLSFGIEAPCASDWGYVRDIMMRLRMKTTLRFMEAIELSLRECPCSDRGFEHSSPRHIPVVSPKSPEELKRNGIATNGVVTSHAHSISSETLSSNCSEASSASLSEDAFDSEIAGSGVVSDDGESHDDMSRHEIIGEDWQDVLSYAERVKIQLGRAFVSNPEVLVLQRPLHSGNIADLLADVIREFVDKRGICSSADTFAKRLPRTCFFSPESKEQMKLADTIWCISQGSLGGEVTQITHDELEAMEVSDRSGESGGLGKHKHLLNSP